MFVLIYITGDLHGNIDYHNKPLKQIQGGQEDYLIIAGDFGVLWDDVPDKIEKKLLRNLENLGPTILFIDGNHENFNRLDALPTKEMLGGDVGVVSEKIFHLRRGRIYTIENQTFFCFGGALSTDKKYRIKDISYWEKELPSPEEYQFALDNLEKYDFKVDYLITHAAPSGIKNILVIKNKTHDPTEGYLNEIQQRVVFKKWYFGHYHIDRNLGYYIALYNNIITIED